MKALIDQLSETRTLTAQEWKALLQNRTEETDLYARAPGTH